MEILMTVEELVAKHNGVILSNKARVTIGGQQVIVGRAGANGFELTAEGEALANSYVKIEIPEATTRTRKKSVQSTDE